MRPRRMWTLQEQAEKLQEIESLRAQVKQWEDREVTQAVRCDRHCQEAVREEREAAVAYLREWGLDVHADRFERREHRK